MVEEDDVIAGHLGPRSRIIAIGNLGNLDHKPNRTDKARIEEAK